MCPFVSTAILVCAVLSLLSLSHACPKECSCNSNTKAVDCRGRGLYDIPRRLHPDTQELYLQDNRIRGLGSMAFREIPLVRILDISNNSITTISPTALLGLRMLQRLSLAHNNLRELDKRLLGPIRSLSHLDLSHNRLDLDARKKSCVPRFDFAWLLFYFVSFPFHQPVGFAGSHGGQFEEPQPPGASTQQADTIRSFPVGGPDTPGQPCTTQQPLEVWLPTYRPQTLAGDLPL